MSEFKVICVTQSTLFESESDFLKQTEKICKGGIDRIILREKHLRESQYTALAKQVSQICIQNGIPLTLHNFYDVAKEMNSQSFHCSYRDFMEKSPQFKQTGVSVHSLKEAENCMENGASYITAGHVFATQCKAGLSPRGVGFIEEICQKVTIPVFAIGGITPDNISQLKNSGVSGVCVMSSLMTAADPENFIHMLKS